MSNMGHNSKKEGITELVRRFQKLLEDQAELASELRDLGKEAAERGFSPRVLKELAKDNIDPERRKKREALIDEMDQTRAIMGIVD